MSNLILLSNPVEYSANIHDHIEIYAGQGSGLKPYSQPVVNNNNAPSNSTDLKSQMEAEKARIEAKASATESEIHNTSVADKNLTRTGAAYWASKVAMTIVDPYGIHEKKNKNK